MASVLRSVGEIEAYAASSAAVAAAMDGLLAAFESWAAAALARLVRAGAADSDEPLLRRIWTLSRQRPGQHVGWEAWGMGVLEVIGSVAARGAEFLERHSGLASRAEADATQASLGPYFYSISSSVSPTRLRPRRLRRVLALISIASCVPYLQHA